MNMHAQFSQTCSKLATTGSLNVHIALVTIYMHSLKDSYDILLQDGALDIFDSLRAEIFSIMLKKLSQIGIILSRFT